MSSTSLIPPGPISGTQQASFPETNPSEATASSPQTTSLKVVIVGNEGVGKTSFVKRFVAEELGILIDEVTPTASSSSAGSLSNLSPPQRHRPRLRERPPGTISTGIQQNSEVELDIYELEFPTADEAFSSENSKEDGSTEMLYRLSIWDFSGSAESLQAVQKVFFTRDTLYVVLWDMAAKAVAPLEYECATSTLTAKESPGRNSSSIDNHSQQSIKYSAHRNGSRSQSQKSASSSFNLGYYSDSDSSDYDYCNDCDVDAYNQEELRDAKRKLEKDIDKRVQSWIDRIQARAPGATILPMVTHTDRLRPKSQPDLTDPSTSLVSDELQQKEIKKRCWLLKERLASNESRKVERLKESGMDVLPENRSRPNFLFGSVQKDGQVIPHAIASTATYHEDDEMDYIHMDNGLVPQMYRGYESDENFLSARNFIFSSALSIASRSNGNGKKEIGFYTKDDTRSLENITDGEGQSTPASLATVMLRDVREKLWHRSKIVQTNYFVDKFEARERSRKAMGHSRTVDEDEFTKTTHESAVLSALRSLHLSGELCYFGGLARSPGSQDTEHYSGIQLLSDFVVLDPTWLVDSIDFIIQYGRKFVQNTTTDRVTASASSGRHRATNCPTIDKEEIRRLWKNRYNTRNGLGLAEHYHQFQHGGEEPRNRNSVADQVFEFMKSLLVLYDIFVPLSYQKSGSSQHFFLPCLLQRKNAYSDTVIGDASQRNLLAPVSSILEDRSHSTNLIPENQRYTESTIDADSENLKEACHGFVIVDTPPETIIERAITYITILLGEYWSTTKEPKIEAEMLYFWKDSFRLKLRAHGGRLIREEVVEINCVLLEATGFGTNSRIDTCESMLVTYVEGCSDSESRELWKQTFEILRGALQNALDEIPGIEYREQGICPYCLQMKQISDTGTWTLSKLKSASDNKEAFVRCRHGHRIETKLNGLLHCQLVEPVPDSSSRPYRQQPFPSRADARNLDQVSTGPKRYLVKDITKRKDNVVDGSIDSRDVTVSPSVDNVHIVERRARFEEMTFDKQLMEVEKKENNQVSNSKVTILIDNCKSKMGRVFQKKYHINLDNRNLTACQIPMEKLKGTKLGDQLQSMSLAHNNLETVPQSLVRCLPNLRSLDLSHCLIYELPKRWNLPLLKKLDISHNLLFEFPEEGILLGLLELEELNLSGNKLKKVKVSSNPIILKKLKRLDLSSNELISFPTALARFDGLKSLDINLNNIPEHKKRKPRRQQIGWSDLGG